MLLFPTTTLYAKYDQSDFNFDVEALVFDIPTNASPNIRGDNRGCIIIIWIVPCCVVGDDCCCRDCDDDEKNNTKCLLLV
jgi:hypothetical protein